ncbi:hypothetical protein D3C81_1042480 [compost metagenome]
MHTQTIESLHALAVHALEALQSCQVRLEPLGLHQRLAGQVEQAVEAVGGDPQHTLRAFASAFASLAPWRGLKLEFRLHGLGGHRHGLHPHGFDRHGLHGCCRQNRGHRHRRSAWVQQAGHMREKHWQRRLRGSVAWRCDSHQQVGALQQRIDMLGVQPQAAFLGSHQAVFHDVGNTDASVDPDNARRPLQGVGRTHAGLQLVGLGGVALQRHQASAEYLGLRLGFQAEQLEQRCVAHLLWGHVRLRCTADSNC